MAGGKTEEFFWDGLALIKRGGTSYVNEPAVTGGNPILATNDKSEKVLFNDMLGSTMGNISSGKDYAAVDMTFFGESKTEDEDKFFTGKPEVDGLGYAFAFRNYRSNLGKWQTADPLGYPDGWNNKAYVNNWVVGCIDRFGTDVYHLLDADGVGGVGHSAWIIGNDNDGYTYYDYGPWALIFDPRQTRQTFSSLTAAMDSAIGQDDYDHMQKWDTTADQDSAAITAADDYIAESYLPNGHNCYELGPLGIMNAINEEDMINSILMSSISGPNMAFNENLNKNYAQDVTSILQQRIEQHGE